MHIYICSQNLRQFEKFNVYVLKNLLVWYNKFDTSLQRGLYISKSDYFWLDYWSFSLIFF